MPSDRTNKAHKAFIRTLPCVSCMTNWPIHCAHVKMRNFNGTYYDKEENAMSRKPSDKWTVPLCGTCHSLQHNRGERWFWQDYCAGLDPLELAQRLWENTGNRSAALGIIQRRRNGATEL